jgi:hypothetical protein
LLTTFPWRTRGSDVHASGASPTAAASRTNFALPPRGDICCIVASAQSVTQFIPAPSLATARRTTRGTLSRMPRAPAAPSSSIFACFLALATSCATGPEPAEEERPRKTAKTSAAGTRPDGGADAAPASADALEPDRPPFDPNAGMEMKTVSEREWSAGVKQRVASREKIDPALLRFSPARTLLVFVRTTGGPPPPPPAQAAPNGAAKKAGGAANRRPRKKVVAGRPPPRRHQIVVVDTEGRRRAVFNPVQARGSDEPPRDLRFLSEDRLVYEVVSPPAAETPAKAAAPARPNGRRGARAAGKRRASRAAVAPPAEAPKKAPPRAVADAASLPERLFVIQPVGRRARPLRCQGVRFTFPATGDHLAFVAGSPEASFVSVDGQQVYPRRGRTIVASEPAWSRDGNALAFIEVREQGPPRLVLLAQFDNPTGDTTWDIPASASLDGARVFWSGPGKLTVGKTLMRPLFATSFTREIPKVLPRDP